MCDQMLGLGAYAKGCDAAMDPALLRQRIEIRLLLPNGDSGLFYFYGPGGGNPMVAAALKSTLEREVVCKGTREYFNGDMGFVE